VIPSSVDQRVSENRTHLGEIYWGNFAFFKKLGTVDNEDAAEVEFPRVRGTR
jgi:hypothetical protein